MKPVPVFSIVSVAGGFALHRDGAQVKTLGGNDFLLPTRLLAEAIAAEWREQFAKSRPDTAAMPMTQLASTTIDITKKQRAHVIDQIAGYVTGDVLCNRADHPDDLILQQQKLWQPVLDWCARRFDALLRAGEGIMPIAQSLEAVKALRRAVEAYDDLQLTGLKHAAELAHSLVLGLALIEKYLTADQVFAAAECDALFQMQRWGEDPASITRHQSIRQDLANCEKWFALLR